MFHSHKSAIFTCQNIRTKMQSVHAIWIKIRIQMTQAKIVYNITQKGFMKMEKITFMSNTIVPNEILLNSPARKIVGKKCVFSLRAYYANKYPKPTNMVFFLFYNHHSHSYWLTDTNIRLQNYILLCQHCQLVEKFLKK